jgi:hypothetical protein
MESQFKEVTNQCLDIIKYKNELYGYSWLDMRLLSMIDIIYAKLIRIRNIEQLGSRKIEDSITDDYMGVINYSAMAYIKMNHPNADGYTQGEMFKLFESIFDEAYNLMLNKNHDYANAWQKINKTSLTDFMIAKYHRMNHLIHNFDGNESAYKSSMHDNLLDMINHSIFYILRTK